MSDMNRKELIQGMLNESRKGLDWDKFTALDFQESMVFFAALSEGIVGILKDDKLSEEDQVKLIGHLAIQLGAQTITNMGVKG